MSDEFLSRVVPIYFWLLIGLNILGAIINALALALDLPPTKMEIGSGLRVLKALGGVFGAWFIWSIYRYLVPA